MKRIMTKSAAALMALILIVLTLPVCIGTFACMYDPGHSSLTPGGNIVNGNTLFPGYSKILPDNGSLAGPATSEKALKGDINEDNEIDAYDATLILKYAAGMTELSLSQFISADVSGDGIVDTQDAAMIFQYDAGAINEF